MRATKTQKSKTTTKPIINLPESNSNLNVSSQTPIEIALQIDENGMTNLEGVFAGGDVTESKSTVCRALAAGKRAANGIDKMFENLEKKEN